MTELAVVGAGTMGAGIASSAILAGLSTTVVDTQESALARGRESVEGNLEYRVRKGHLSEADRGRALELLNTTTSLDACSDAPFVIEAVFEDMEAKRNVFSRLDSITSHEAVLATNTSSLSVADIATTTERPGRVVGMHFFNPVPAMRLVEVVAGPATEPDAVRRAVEMANVLGKTPVVVSDTPGFIVNRVARPFYLEGLRLVEAGGDPTQIDAAIRGAGFRMGPFELMDLIGVDINLATSESLYERYYGHPRFRPSWVQRRMVEAGLLGRKSGRGFYNHGERERLAEKVLPEGKARDMTVVGDADLARALGVEPDGSGFQIIALQDTRTLAGTGASVGVRRLNPLADTLELVGEVDRATRERVETIVHAAGLIPAWTPDLPCGAALRTVCALANEAAFALGEGIASAVDIDRAMRLGTNYPRGPLEWADELGLERVAHVLDALRTVHGDAYAVAPLLRRCLESGKLLTGGPSGSAL